MGVGVVEAGDNRFALAVDELFLSSEEVEVGIGANPNYFPSFRCRQLRRGPMGITRQYVGIIEDKVCCSCAQYSPAIL